MESVTGGDGLTDTEELRVHTVEVGDEEHGIRSSDVEKQQVPSGQVQDQTSTVDHKQTDQLHGKNHSGKQTTVLERDSLNHG